MSNLTSSEYDFTPIVTELNTSAQEAISESGQGVLATQISKMPEQVRQASDNKYMRLS
jgi:hypothetical protein